jgi:hypothetical protein
MLPMTATLKRVWTSYRIATMVKATPDESAAYLKEVKKEQKKRGHDWTPSTWNRYRERAAALFTYTAEVLHLNATQARLTP